MTEAPITLEYVKTIHEAHQNNERLTHSQARERVHSNNRTASLTSGLPWDLTTENGISCLSRNPDGTINVSHPLKLVLADCPPCPLNSACSLSQSKHNLTPNISLQDTETTKKRIRNKWPYNDGWLSLEEAEMERNRIFELLNKWRENNSFNIQNLLVFGSFAAQECYIRNDSDIDLMALFPSSFGKYNAWGLLEEVKIELEPILSRKVHMLILSGCDNWEKLKSEILRSFKFLRPPLQANLNLIPMLTPEFISLLNNAKT